MHGIWCSNDKSQLQHVLKDFAQMHIFNKINPWKEGCLKKKTIHCCLLLIFFEKVWFKSWLESVKLFSFEWVHGAKYTSIQGLSLQNTLTTQPTNCVLGTSCIVLLHDCKPVLNVLTFKYLFIYARTISFSVFHVRVSILNLGLASIKCFLKIVLYMWVKCITPMTT